MKIRPLKALCVLVVFSSMAGEMLGSLFYGNYTSPSSDGSAISYDTFVNGTLGARRSTNLGYTGDDLWALEYVELNLSMQSGDPGDVHVYLYQQLWEPVVAELHAATPIAGQADYSFFPAAPVYLTPGKFYNLVVEPAFVNGTYVNWYYAPDRYDGTKRSTFDSFVSDSWIPWETAHTESLTARVYADIVPEPATCALVGFGGLLCVWATRRRTCRRRPP